MFTISCLKSSLSNFFCLKGMVFKVAQKVELTIWATLVKKYVTKNLKNRPIWSHCLCLITKAFDVQLLICSGSRYPDT